MADYGRPEQSRTGGIMRTSTRVTEDSSSPFSALGAAEVADTQSLGRQLKQVARHRSRRAGLKSVGVRRVKGTRDSAAVAGGLPLPRDSATKADHRAALEELLQRLQLLPAGSRYVRHRIRCARSALQLIDQPE